MVRVTSNPFNSSFRINLFSEKQQSIELQLFDSEGKLIFRRISPPENILDINTSNYAKGNYILRLQQGDFLKTITLIKQ